MLDSTIQMFDGTDPLQQYDPIRRIDLTEQIIAELNDCNRTPSGKINRYESFRAAYVMGIIDSYYDYNEQFSIKYIFENDYEFSILDPSLGSILDAAMKALNEIKCITETLVKEIGGNSESAGIVRLLLSGENVDEVMDSLDRLPYIQRKSILCAYNTHKNTMVSEESEQQAA